MKQRLQTFANDIELIAKRLTGAGVFYFSLGATLAEGLRFLLWAACG